MAGTRQTSIRPAATAPAFAAIAGVFVGFIEPFQAAWLGAGALAATAIASASRDMRDSLHPAHLQLAHFRRTTMPADILVIRFPTGRSIRRRSASRRGATAARSLLRVTDGVAIIPAVHGHGICAVLEPDPRARAAIEHRLRDVCGSEFGLGWARFPEDGVTLESLIAAATDRIPDRGRPRSGQRLHQVRPAGHLARDRADVGRAPMRRAR